MHIPICSISCHVFCCAEIGAFLFLWLLMWRVLGVHCVLSSYSSWLIFMCYRDQIIKSITKYQSIMWLFPVPYIKDIFFYCVFWKFEIQIICRHSPLCSLTAKRSWQRLDQVEAQQTKFFQWVLICQDRNLEKFGTSSAAEINVSFSLTHFSWDNQIERNYCNGWLYAV